jgi:hypothetical protein
MSGFTRSQSSSDTVHDLMALMAQDTMNALSISRCYLRISSKDFLTFSGRKKEKV